MQNILQKFESVLSVKKYPSKYERELFSKTQNFVSSIKWIPGLRMVAISNSLAMYATHKESDIDLFIITAPRRLWLVRTLILVIASILGVRTKPRREAGRFCFPFFMTDKNLSLEKIAIENDIYLSYWMQTLKPICNIYSTYEHFMETNRDFCEKTLQIETNQEERSILIEANRTFLILKEQDGVLRKRTRYSQNSKILSLLGDIIDRGLEGISKRWIMKKIIPSADTEGIIVNDDMLKLHFIDRRREIRNQVFGE